VFRQVPLKVPSFALEHVLSSVAECFPNKPSANIQTANTPSGFKAISPASQPRNQASRPLSAIQPTTNAFGCPAYMSDAGNQSIHTTRAITATPRSTASVSPRLISIAKAAYFMSGLSVLACVAVVIARADCVATPVARSSFEPRSHSLFLAAS
jgi:hypothetical protein